MAEDTVYHTSLELQNVLQKNPNLQFDSVKKKIRCSLSGHEMPYSLEIVNSYLQGKKYKKLFASQQFEYDELKPHIVQSNNKGREHQLFCLLTLRHINRQPEHIQRHINGHRFKKALAKWEECKRTGQEFKPYPRQRRKNGPGTQQSSRSEFASDKDMEGAGEESDADSLSDLYPMKELGDEIEEEPMEVGEMAESDQKENEENSESDYDFEDMNDTNPSSTQVQGHKRKMAFEEKSSKKLKSMKKGKKNVKSHVS